MLISEVPEDRVSHWIRPNHQCRIPKRWIAFNTEANTREGYDERIQSWSQGAAIFWRRGLKARDAREDKVFYTPEDMWRSVAEFCRPDSRTVAITHGLGGHVRISRLLEILPTLGFKLEWSNISNNVSTMSWRSDNGTLVFADLSTWLPLPLHKIAKLIDTDRRYEGTGQTTGYADKDRCIRGSETIYLAKSEILDWIQTNDLGNWQPTGPGMAYATWRHKFMEHKVLVHDNKDVIDAERCAMHTGRVEAWRHGVLSGDTWHEIDLRAAYTRIAAESELPTKYKFSTKGITQAQYEGLSSVYRINCLVDVSTDEPVAPYYNGYHTLWPVGQYRTWLWDVEINELLARNASVKILAANVYTKAPALSQWANWILSVRDGTGNCSSPVIQAYAKHAGRALIGRLSMRTPRWELYGTNPSGEVGISYSVEHATGDIHRMLHVGNDTFMETARIEARDSLPQITGWIMAECRVRLFWAMETAGFDNIAHVDTDSLICNSEGLARLKATYRNAWDQMWSRKGSWTSLDVYGPRALRTGRDRKASGIPLNATETTRDTFIGEQWHSLAGDLASGRPGEVTITEAMWTMRRIDPRRRIASGVDGKTKPIRLPL